MVATVRDNVSPIARTLRLSITGECNLSCFYCRSVGSSRELFSTKNPVQPSDVTKLIRIVGELGVTKILIGGGEPLLRKDAANFVKAAFAHKAISDVRLVTNGTFLKTFADPLRKMGLRKVDVAFDSLNFMKYQRITGRDSLYRVLDGIDKVEKLNFSEIRLHIHLLKGINEEEVIDFARMTKDRPLHVRFLEYCPRTANGDPYASRLGLPVYEVRRAIENFQTLVRVYDLETEVPVPTYRFADAVGKISFLGPSEIDAEEAVPRILFNVEGVLSNELVPNRPQPILADLRRDAKEDRLHRVIEKVMALQPEPKKMVAKPTKKIPAMVPPKKRVHAGHAARR
ncbi:MAG: radical SAM protein [Pseudomonadota bacterium]